MEPQKDHKGVRAAPEILAITDINTRHDNIAGSENVILKAFSKIFQHYERFV